MNQLQSVPGTNQQQAMGIKFFVVINISKIYIYLYLQGFEDILDGKTFHGFELKGDLPGKTLFTDFVDDLTR